MGVLVEDVRSSECDDQDEKADFSTTRPTMKLWAASVEMTGLFDGVEKTGSKDKCNRRSFDCGTHDGAVSAFAQDDNFF